MKLILAIILFALGVAGAYAHLKSQEEELTAVEMRKARFAHEQEELAAKLVEVSAKLNTQRKFLEENTKNASEKALREAEEVFLRKRQALEEELREAREDALKDQAKKLSNLAEIKASLAANELRVATLSRENTKLLGMVTAEEAAKGAPSRFLYRPSGVRTEADSNDYYEVRRSTSR